MDTLMMANPPATCLPAFLPAGKLCPAYQPNKQTAAFLDPPADSSPTDKEPAPDGEFAALLAVLQGQVSVKAGGGSAQVTAELPAPAGLRMAEQHGCLPGLGAGALLMQKKLPAGSEAVCLASLNMQHLAGTPASPILQAVLKPEELSMLYALQDDVSRKAIVVSLRPGELLVPAAPLNGQAGAEMALAMALLEGATMEATGLQGLKNSFAQLPSLSGQDGAEKVLAEAMPEAATAGGTELQRLKNSFEQQQPPLQGEETGLGPVKTAFAATGLPSAVQAERSLTGGAEQEQGEGKPAESGLQAVFKAAGSVAEPVQAEIVRRLEAVKSAVVEQVLEKMVFSRTESGEAKVYIRLKPPALGEVEISLQMEEGRLTGRIVAESLLVREALEASLGQLRQRLEAQQIQVAELTVGTGQEKGFHHGRDRTEVLTPFPWGREQPREEASPQPAAAPGLLNALA